ncbi:MAG: U32 family peptidase [Anaerolineales bacterium]|nr:U32 family peptidase [Anaerolineales bacterium]
MTQRLPKPEIMSPAGHWPELNAAIEAGADAVYFGLTHFTARAKVGFTLAELPQVMQTLHRRGVKGYVTFNTLIFDHELAEAGRTVAAIAAAGADSIIVQDMGMAQLAHQIAPDLAIHGSTQMSITSAEGIALAQQVGVSRVVLARELALKEIGAIRAATDCELEMFVHGALCVSYSGQCFSSEAWGGRSANRGQCAQACRLPYELLVDGETVSENLAIFARPKHLLLPRPELGWEVTEGENGTYEIAVTSDKPALWVWLEVKMAAQLSDNFFHLGGENGRKTLTLTPDTPNHDLAAIKSSLAVYSLHDTYQP